MNSMDKTSDAEDWPDIYSTGLIPAEMLDQCLDLLEQGIEFDNIVAETDIPRRSLLHAISCRYFDEGNPDLARALIKEEALETADFRLLIQLIRSIFSSPSDDETALLEAARRLTFSLTKRLDEKHLLSPEPTPTQPGKELKIAFLASWAYTSLFEGSVAQLVEQIDRSKFEIGLLYVKRPNHENLPEIIRQPFDFHAVLTAGDEQKTFNQITNFNIDILFDLNGHLCVENPTIALMQKPAKILVNWMNSPVSSHIPAYDYYLTDPFTVPNEKQYIFSEKLYYLDNNCMTTFSLPDIDIQPSPVADGYSFVFGSFNEMFKLNPFTLGVWAKILEQCPESALVLKANSLSVKETRKINHIRRHLLDSSSIAPNRILITPPKPYNQMLDDYGSLDLTLGPIRYNGLTTTINSLWMGVPVLCYIGDKVEDRAAGAVLKQLGLDDFLAFSIDEYIQKAVYLASNPQQLIDLRTTLRSKALASAYYNPKAFAKSFENACIDMSIKANALGG